MDWYVVKPYCHSGLDPWFDRLTILSEVKGLTTLSKVEGESSVFPDLDLIISTLENL